MARTDLEIVDGRVLAKEGGAVTVEFTPGAQPGPGAWLGCGESLLEVTTRLNPSEVRAVVRAGHAPAPGATCETIGPRALRVTAGGVATLTASNGGSTIPVLSRQAVGAITHRPSRAVQQVVAWGHPGLDVLCPILDGQSASLAAGLGLAEPEIATALSLHLRRERRLGVRVVWAEGRRPWPPIEALVDDGDVRLSAAVPGGLAILPRLALSVAAASLAAGTPVVLVFVEPEAMIRAFGAAEGASRDPRVAGVEAFADVLAALDRLEGPGRHAVALLGGHESEAALSSTATAALDACFTGHARFDDGRLVMAETWSPERHGEAVGEGRRALADAIGELLPLSLEVADYAVIFGQEELDDAQHEVVEALEGLGRWLGVTPEEPVEVEEAVARAVALLRGA